MSAGDLIIYGAAFGRSDVTGKVKSLVRHNRLNVQVDISLFGDTWNDVRKVITVVYQYLHHGSQPQIMTAVEGSSLVIDPSSCKRSSPVPSTALKILGAAYGLKDVTDKARSLVACNKQGLNEFKVIAENSVWGDGWRGHRKSLVVVYEAYGVIKVVVTPESDRMHFVAYPSLTILGAAYGLRTVTDIVAEFIDDNHNLNGIANNKAFGDTWKGITKSFMAVCQYGNQIPVVVAVREKSKFQLSFSSKPVFVASTDPRALVILGAAYGPVDVTCKVQELVQSQGGYSLEVKATNSLFGDSWPGQRKSFSVVYCHGSGSPQVSTVEENQTLIIKSSGCIPTHPPRYTGQLPMPCPLGYPTAAPHLVVPLPTVQYTTPTSGQYPAGPPPMGGGYPMGQPPAGQYQYAPQGNPPPYKPY